MKCKMILCAAITYISSCCANAQYNPYNTDHRLVVEAGYQATTSVVFSSPILAADYGSGDLLVKPLSKDPRILKIKAVKKDFVPTNITVLTAEGKLYSIPVMYAEFPAALLYYYTDTIADPRTMIALPAEPYTQQLKTTCLAELIRQLPTTHRHKKAVTKNQVRLALDNIFLCDDQLFFRFTISNRSNIPYDIHLLQFFIRDKTKSKKTSYLEKEIMPTYQWIEDSTINRTSVLVVALHKFTIADDKYFTTQLNEKNGDRFIQLNIKGRHILHANSNNQQDMK